MLSGAAIRRCTCSAIAILGSACTAGRTVSLGDRSPRPYHFDPPQPVPELASLVRSDNPTLTADLLEIYFTSDRVGGSGGGDVWTARRSVASSTFEAPFPVVEVNAISFETSSAISADGLTLWFGSDRAGGVGVLDIWVSGRATRSSVWSTPVNVVALNSPAEDIPRPPGLHGLVMPLASIQAVPGNYQTYFATRPTQGAPFGSPVAIPELDHTDRSTVDAFLADDGLTLFFSSALSVAPAGDASSAVDGATAIDGGVAPTSDLFVAWRRSLDEPFSITQPLDDLNTAADERDPWLTPDGKTLYFTSDRAGVLGIYTAAVRPR